MIIGFSYKGYIKYEIYESSEKQCPESEKLRVRQVGDKLDLKRNLKQCSAMILGTKHDKRCYGLDVKCLSKSHILWRHCPQLWHYWEWLDHECANLIHWHVHSWMGVSRKALVEGNDTLRVCLLRVFLIPRTHFPPHLSFPWIMTWAALLHNLLLIRIP